MSATEKVRARKLASTTVFSIVGHVVVQTYYCRRPGGEPYYEIHLAMDDGEKTPRTVLLSHDAALYEWALAREGTDQRVDAAWRAGRRHDGRVAQVVSALRAHREAA